MQIPLQIAFLNLPRSDALETRIREKAARLEEFHPRITGCHVTVEELDRHRHQGKQFRVRLVVHVPGREIAVDREHHEDAFVALRDAFDAAARQIEDVVRVKRGDVKSHASIEYGKVVRLFAEEGYGFIETEDGKELYFSRDNVVDPAFDDLEIDTPVRFIEEAAALGAQAKRVTAHHR